MQGKLFITLIALFLLTACASTNPREGGFIGGLQGIFSGAYDARIQNGQRELSEVERRNQSLQEESKSLDAEVRARDRMLAMEQDRLANMQNDIYRLEFDTNKLVAKSDEQKIEIASLKRKIEDQRSQLKSLQSAVRDLDQAGGSASNPGRYEVLKRERERLNMEYRRLLEYNRALSRATN